MQDPLKTLQQIAFGHVVLPSGKTRQMYNYEMINLAREACDQLGIAYSNGACTQPFEAHSVELSLKVPELIGSPASMQVHRVCGWDDVCSHRGAGPGSMVEQLRSICRVRRESGPVLN